LFTRTVDSPETVQWPTPKKLPTTTGTCDRTVTFTRLPRASETVDPLTVSSTSPVQPTAWLATVEMDAKQTLTVGLAPAAMT
jgi:hypothetical protein